MEFSRQEYWSAAGQRCCCRPCPYLAQRGCLLVHTGHRVFYECGVWHAGGPRVPSADEGRAALLVPLDANPKAFSPAGSEDRDQTSQAGPCPRAPAWCWVWEQKAVPPVKMRLIMAISQQPRTRGSGQAKQWRERGDSAAGRANDSFGVRCRAGAAARCEE